MHAITQRVSHLYSLDLSFCTKLTVSALVSLLEIRGHSLAELRLLGCRNLDIARDPNGPPAPRGQNVGGYAGRLMLAALRSHDGRCCLSVLDVRDCAGQPSMTTDYPINDPFVVGMAALQFEQTVPGFFARPARWNRDVERHLVKQIFVSTSEAPL